MNKAYRLIYYGKVQGVGFRYSVKRIADQHKIVGWARNLPDGTVEALAQGSELNIESFLKAVGLYFRDNIRDRKTIAEPLREFDGFGVRY